MEIIVNKADNLTQSKLSSIKNLNEQLTLEKQKVNNTTLTRENVENAVDALNSAAKSVDRRISFTYNKKANRVIMKVSDLHTNDIIREIPPKEVVKLLERFHELLGMFVDELR
ncbi:MAG: flagellar protein FlaG [Spirochaetota bacterium]|nr:flagellar protein FlaG [Spirochaetota bacterium]